MSSRPRAMQTPRAVLCLAILTCTGIHGADSALLRAPRRSGSKKWSKRPRHATRVPSASVEHAVSFCDAGDGWVRDFADEFDGPILDQSSWSHVESSGGGDNTNSPVEGLDVTACRSAKCRSQNVLIGNGTLTLLSERDAENPSRYYTGAVTTKGLRAWSDESPYRLCVKAKLPRGGPHGQGLWPAHWMLPENGYSDRCLDEGEMDIMEMVNGDGNVYSTYHWMSSWPDGERCGAFDDFHESDAHRAYLPDDWSTAFHEYAVERSHDQISFAIDGRVVFRTSEKMQGFTLSRAPFFLILNTAIGGDWPGEPSAETEFPARHVIDYVRAARKQSPGGKVALATQPPSAAQCMYINLPSRSDRRDRIESELHRVGLSCTRVEGVDGNLVGASGREGCRRSHLLALARLHESGAPYGLVLEDDAAWSKPDNVVREMLAKVPEGMRERPVILVSCNGVGSSTEETWLKQVEDCQTTSAYFVRRDYIPVLQALWEKASDDNPIDIAWKSLQRKDRWGMMQPLLVKQAASYSDIEHRFVDYKVFQQWAPVGLT
mmetsp:Transcript_60352/g.168625  ORF Transcript_60352/g.168625 Transcript_60352/m.168625 type:complete len:547 (+) Transcript_60352:52-1692(+)